jgi:hypothetical protein
MVPSLSPDGVRFFAASPDFGKIANVCRKIVDLHQARAAPPPLAAGSIDKPGALALLDHR